MCIKKLRVCCSSSRTSAHSPTPSNLKNNHIKKTLCRIFTAITATMQYKVALLSFFAALAVAAPTPDGLPDGTTCTIDSTTTTKCVGGTCYAANSGCSSRICAVPSGSEVGSCQTATKRSLFARDGLPDGTICNVGEGVQTVCKDGKLLDTVNKKVRGLTRICHAGTCYGGNAGCNSRICAIPEGESMGTCQTATK
ncbi:hypothetical protein IWX92DRAFT_222458 [Phyllosticta citricarpa]